MNTSEISGFFFEGVELNLSDFVVANMVFVLG